MAHESYRQCTIISVSYRKSCVGFWIPKVTVICRIKHEFQYHEFPEVEQTFPTQEEAIAFGFTIARAWIDKFL
jgi:hypothetical protein